jgi:ABC-type transport system involved in multi-copper enzyme maturation permease subunit
MFKTLFIKEIQESILNLRFFFIFLICIVLIPLSFYLSGDEYKHRKEHINNLEIHYLQQNEGNIRYDIRAEGYRPPSPYSIFCLGLENYLPDKVVTSREGNLQFERQWGINNPISLLTGKIDFLYVVCFIMSLLALSLTFNSISGEKENGTLRLMLSNQVPKWKIIVAKIIGPYTIFAISFIVGILFGLIVLLVTNTGIEFNTAFIKVLLLVVLFSLLFLFILFNLGIYISIIGKSTFLAMIISLFIYVLFSMLIPKISPMMAQVIHPVKSLQVHNTEKNLLWEQIVNDRENEKKKLMNKLKTDVDLPLSLEELDKNPGQRKLYDDIIEKEYDEQIKPIDEKYNDRLVSEMSKIEAAYQHEITIQKGIAINVSRLSPFSSYINLIADFSSTGFSEMENYQEQAKLFNDFVRSEIYDKLVLKRYYDAYGYLQRLDNKGFDNKNVAVPRIANYQYMKTSYVITKNWPDLLLICLFAILFFTLSVTGFHKYDVR